MMLDALILAVGAGLAGLLGSVGQSLRKPFNAGRFEGARLPGSVRALEALAWAGCVTLLVLAFSSRGSAVLLPALVPAVAARAEGVVRRLDLLEPGELVQLAFATTLGVVACTLALAQRRLGIGDVGDRAAVLHTGDVLPPIAIASLIVLALVTLSRRRSDRPGRARAEAARIAAEHIAAR